MIQMVPKTALLQFSQLSLKIAPRAHETLVVHAPNLQKSFQKRLCFNQKPDQTCIPNKQQNDIRSLTVLFVRRLLLSLFHSMFTVLSVQITHIQQKQKLQSALSTTEDALQKLTLSERRFQRKSEEAAERAASFLDTHLRDDSATLPRHSMTSATFSY